MSSLVLRRLAGPGVVGLVVACCLLSLHARGTGTYLGFTLGLSPDGQSAVVAAQDLNGQAWNLLLHPGSTILKVDDTDARQLVGASLPNV